MIKYISVVAVVLFSLLTTPACTQVTVSTDRPAINQAAFDQRLQELLSFTVPLLGVDELANAQVGEYLILDAREKKEYKISHIPGAMPFGYNNPDWKMMDNVKKDQPILLYCSVGYRSEKMAEKFRKQGFTNVFNLYGSIFEWANRGQPLEDKDGQPTRKIHTYNKRWSQWVENDKGLEKTW